MCRVGVVNARCTHNDIEEIHQRVGIRNEVPSMLVSKDLVAVSPDVVDPAFFHVDLDLSPNLLRRIISQRAQSNPAKIAADAEAAHHLEESLDCRVYYFGNVLKLRELF